MVVAAGRRHSGEGGHCACGWKLRLASSLSGYEEDQARHLHRRRCRNQVRPATPSPIRMSRPLTPPQPYDVNDDLHKPELPEPRSTLLVLY
jgi:hypothetical protein